MSGETLKKCFSDSFSIFGEKKAISFLRDGIIETEISYQELDKDSNRVPIPFWVWG